MNRVLSYVLSFAFLMLFTAGVGVAETRGPTLQIIRGDEYTDWSLVYSAWLYTDHGAAIFVCKRGGQSTVMIAERTGEDFAVAARNDMLFKDGVLQETNNLWILDKNKDGHPYVWYIGEDPADTFYLVMEKSETGVWQITSGFFGDEYMDDYINFFVTNGGAALGVNDVIMWQPQVYVPLAWDMTLQGFDPQVVRAACKEAMTHKGEPGIIPSTLEPNALPQGSLIPLRGHQAYPVYTGPGEEYQRLGGEWHTDAEWEAFVSNESWIQAFGQENGWVLIRYDSMRGIHRISRFGYIPRSAFAEDAEIPALEWLPYDAVLTGGLESDPLTSAGEYYYDVDEYRNQPCRVLATMGDPWRYVEVYDKNGVGYRGFALEDSVEAR